MPRNGSGTYALPAGNPVVAGTIISATWANPTLSDIANEITMSVPRNGSAPMLANLPMGGYQLSGLGAPSATGQALVFGRDGTLANLTASGTTGAAGKVTASGGLDVIGNVNATGTLAMGSAFESRNKLINGDFSIWQRGNSGSASLAAFTYTADRWTLDPYGAAVTWSNSNADSTGYPASGASLTINGAAGNTGVVIRQRIESKNSCPSIGKQVTLSFWVFTNTPGITVTPALQRANAQDDFSGLTLVETGTPLSTVNGAWVYKTTTFAALPVGVSNGLLLALSLPALGAGVTCIIDKVQLEEGSVATPFVSRPYGQEIALCKRYYRQWTWPAGGYPIAVSQVNSTIAAQPVAVAENTSDMRVTPTITATAPATFAFLNASGTLLPCAAATWVVSSGGTIYANASVSSGLVAGNASVFTSSSGNACSIYATAEL